MRAGQVVDIGVTVTPAASGRARVTIERFDSLATAEFLGTRTAAPSAAGRAQVVIDER